MHFNKSLNTNNNDLECYKISELHPCFDIIIAGYVIFKGFKHWNASCFTEPDHKFDNLVFPDTKFGVQLSS